MDYVESAALKSKSQSQPPPAGGASPKTGKAHRSVENGNSSSSSGDSSESSDSDSSLEDYEENQQPQTVEIMNSQLLAKVIRCESETSRSVVDFVVVVVYRQRQRPIKHRR